MKNDLLIELMSIDTKNLKKKQYDTIKDHAINVLKDIIDDLKNDRLDKIETKITYSPSGDGYGYDIHFIDFNWEGNDDSIDINELIKLLKSLE